MLHHNSVYFYAAIYNTCQQWLFYEKCLYMERKIETGTDTDTERERQSPTMSCVFRIYGFVSLMFYIIFLADGVAATACIV